MILALAVSGVLLVAAGMGIPTAVFAQMPAQGQTVGILFLLGASKTDPPARIKASGQKPKPGKVVDARQKPLSDRTPTKHN